MNIKNTSTALAIILVVALALLFVINKGSFVRTKAVEEYEKSSRQKVNDVGANQDTVWSEREISDMRDGLQTYSIRYGDIGDEFIDSAVAYITTTYKPYERPDTALFSKELRTIVPYKLTKGWTQTSKEKYRNGWLRDCNDENILEPRDRNEFCNCLLEKVMQKYRNLIIKDLKHDTDSSIIRGCMSKYLKPKSRR